jgi:hypothetical protein
VDKAIAGVRLKESRVQNYQCRNFSSHKYFKCKLKRQQRNIKKILFDVLVFLISCLVGGYFVTQSLIVINPSLKEWIIFKRTMNFVSSHY